MHGWADALLKPNGRPFEYGYRLASNIPDGGYQFDLGEIIDVSERVVNEGMICLDSRVELCNFL